MNYKLNFEKLCATYRLGSLGAEPEQIFGGFLHRMYRMTTDEAEYAVKALNPQIMLREAAMLNTIAAEKAAVLALRQGINALPAIRQELGCMHEADGQYYLLFPWVQGQSIRAAAASTRHCILIGETLAAIHLADFTPLHNEFPKEPEADLQQTDWEEYAGQGRAMGHPWAAALHAAADKLCGYEAQVSAAVPVLKGNRLISHRDLDPKNVLWAPDGQPVIIDWEAAGWINPAQELIEVALYWSDFESGHVRKEAFNAIIRAYRSRGGEILDPWPEVLSGGYQGKLGWLEYSIRRSLGLEGPDEAERELGTSQVLPTLQALNEYAGFIPVCLEWLAAID
ncbi:aminoglycoside phosphotransferase family protein [Paenibacillus sp. MMS20-IR301]|uniref:aminoglycoside phosphotransferase family protein n=1 Tax=Paenibacillus sp. MMS20-IR301 TaxID=2895946 RepID=UPI0028EA7ADF|nr:aminoglycoside phosphotransferase family protein [Paenibacillus sp. MMS20-IR301]WNS46305.1 aminoglycoside phosphotransferase family protein [Paenibacillus sp. MMS20-IR301]